MVLLLCMTGLFRLLLIGDLLKNPCIWYVPLRLSTGTASAYRQELSFWHTAEGRVLNGSTRPSALSNLREESKSLRVSLPA